MVGQWSLVDVLPDMGELSGIAMSEDTFAILWQENYKQVLQHLLKKHEGELVELEGQWEKGKGEIPAALFDPQFASIGTD